MVNRYSAKRDGNNALSPHFKVKEFVCKDGTDIVLVESGVVDVLEKMYAHFGCSKINITSGYRTPAHDKRVGGKGKGNHVEGKAADFIAYDKAGKVIPSAKIVLFLEDLDAKTSGAFGIGYRCGGSANATHLDVNYRTNKWYGDEKISMSRSISGIKSGCDSFYAYLGVFKQYKVEVVCSVLSVRSGAGTKYNILDTLSRGQTATITAVNSAKTWGKTDKGWICIKSSYVEAVE